MCPVSHSTVSEICRRHKTANSSRRLMIKGEKKVWQSFLLPVWAPRGLNADIHLYLSLVQRDEFKNQLLFSASYPLVGANYFIITNYLTDCKYKQVTLSQFRVKVSGLTIKADGPDSSLLTVDGPKQMVGKLRSLRSGLWEGHHRTYVDEQTLKTITLILTNRLTIKQMLSRWSEIKTGNIYLKTVHYIWFTKYAHHEHQQFMLLL